MGNILHVRPKDWKVVETNPKPVFVDFWAEWCGPCRMLAPTFERLAEKYSTDISFVKVNVDELPDLANRYAIRSIPTVLLLKGGQEVERLVGLRSFEELAAVLDRYATAPVRK